MASRFTARLPAGHPSARLPARPPDPLCGLGYSPADPRQSEAEGEVCRHAERLLNMVHAYCEIRDSWTGWLRGSAMSRTLHERIVPEMRALRDVERRIVDQPSVTLLAVLDYAARARQAVPAYTPLATIDHPQPPVPDAVREACERLATDAADAALAARRAGAREYAARMAYAIEREREEEARRLRAMKEAAVTETPAEAGDRAALRGAAGADRPGQARRHAARLRWGRSEWPPRDSQRCCLPPAPSALHYRASPARRTLPSAAHAGRGSGDAGDARMTYATLADLEARFGAEEALDLAGKQDGRIESALADAAAEIDAALAAAFRLPLAGGSWPRLVGIACDLARRALYDDVSPAEVTARAERAQAALARLAAGDEALLNDSGQPAPRRDRAAHRGSTPSLTPDSLAGL